MEINDFEDQLVRHGIVLCKFWMHITKDEQLKRFKEREKVPYKRWKLTDDEWRNRDRWDEYEQAVNDMVERTSTVHAPWILVEANNKRFARIKVLETITTQLKSHLPPDRGTFSRLQPYWNLITGLYPWLMVFHLSQDRGGS